MTWEKPDWWPRHWIPSELQRLGKPVQCYWCALGKPHPAYHWYEGCTCAAGGAREDHSDHCGLWGLELVHDDSLLTEPERRYDHPEKKT